MPYNPNIHHRRSIRLKGYDYSKAGLYFITICVKDRKCMFGKIAVGAGFTPAPAQMELNNFGIVAHNQWEKLTERFSNFELDVFQIMPNHMHAIILLNDAPPMVGAGFTPTQYNDDIPAQNDNYATGSIVRTRAIARVAPTTVGDIVGAYKSLVANECLEQFKLNRPNEMMGKLWQRNFHEHIIRDEQSYQRIADYIINNPAKWTDDKFYNE